MRYFEASNMSDCSSLSSLRHSSPVTNSSQDHQLDNEPHLDRARTLVDPMVKLRQRSKTSTFHIRAFITDKAAFLSTNLLEDSEALIPSVGSTWLIGRNSTCAIAIRDLSVSRCHAIIGYHPMDGFYITDLGSSNGTWLNRRRMPLNERLKLENGSLLQFGHVPVDFSITNHGLPASSLLDVTYS